MEKANERRNEQRLRYRWPVRFTMEGENLPFQGQIVDISSKGIAFLCHADQCSFDSQQQLKTSFAVPRFDSGDFFDTVLFERTGYVRRIDKPSSQVYRIALQFASPLFFKPGEQGINEADIQQRLDSKNLSVIKAEETAKAYNEALTKAENQLRLFAQAKVKIEEKLKAEIEDRSRTEARLRAEAEDKIRSYAENAARFEAKLQVRENELKKTAATAQKAEERAKSLEEQLAGLIEQANTEVDRIKDQAAEMLKQIKAKYKDGADQSVKKDLMQKFDDFISDRNKIF